MILGDLSALKPTEYKPLSLIAAVARRKVSSAVADETYQSLPIPVVKNGRLKVEFLYCAAGRTREGSELLAPDYLESMDAMTLRLDHLVSVSPESLGVPGEKMSQVIGVVPPYGGLMPERYEERRSSMLVSMDRLVVPFFAGRVPLSEEQRRAASEFRDGWAALAERPLVAYYDSVGKTFFDWFRRAAP